LNRIETIKNVLYAIKTSSNAHQKNKKHQTVNLDLKARGCY